MLWCGEAMFSIFQTFLLIALFAKSKTSIHEFSSTKEPTHTDWCVNNKTPCKVSIYYQKHKSLCKQKAFKFAYHLDAELVKWRRIHSNLLNGVDGIPPPQQA